MKSHAVNIVLLEILFCRVIFNFDNQSYIFMQYLRPGSDAVLHMSQIEFNELSSCEVRRLNQFETADIIRIGLAVSSRLAQPGITAVDRL